MMVGEDGMPIADAPSDAATFSNLNPNTSDADLMGGNTGAVIWGTNVSIQHSFKAMRDFLFNFEKKYRMIADGELEEGATARAQMQGRAVAPDLLEPDHIAVEVRHLVEIADGERDRADMQGRIGTDGVVEAHREVLSRMVKAQNTGGSGGGGRSAGRFTMADGFSRRREWYRTR